jgi:8-oxo-dGTP diphosphatase
MNIEELKRRHAPRVQAIVRRGSQILMVKHRDEDGEIWCLPGGALEEGETPEEGALRELREEAGIEGRVVRRLATAFDERGSVVAHTYLVDIGSQQPTLGHDPELEGGPSVLVDVRWRPLREIPERDRVFLWRDGLLGVEGFLDEVAAWGDDPSYPGA